MAKIKVQHLAIGADNYMYIIDDKGSIHRRHLPDGGWMPAGELPDEPKPAITQVYVDLTNGLPGHKNKF